MLIIPALDLKDGYVVRYVQGVYDKKIYSYDPVKTARHWVKAGAGFLHVVDLDGAFTGVIKNLKSVKEIAEAVDVPVEFGGGVRDIKTIEKLLRLGIQRVVLGTKAIQDNSFLKRAFEKFRKKIIVSLDVRGENLLIKGWKGCEGKKKAIEFGLFLKKMGFEEAIFTDTSKDGTLSGPNIKDIKRMLKRTSLRIIASGGISSLTDISKLKKLEGEGLVGVVIGKALYEGRFTLKQAIRIG
ncbi:MAG: 1-(5-phosphoribosyl)-5-[(5-phosphoribosylamino)methylideneamino]imidazole-4-carboxamide isomerase [Candidatus Omnitrophica bacterium]|nr:1-(5-phosphoribosyl)-5-[(5-phosphoribosylamino)methylideneamino]imidazole-4-carboxamide isomerase [Candidatus Omnitrophota bacterium]